VAQRLLLVEGSDDRHVVYALLTAHSVPHVFEVLQLEGVERLLDSIPQQLKAADRERLAVLLDADEDLDKRWRQLKGRLEREGHGNLPETPGAEGTIVGLSTGVRFGVWLMPDNRLPGMLEDFVRLLVPTQDTLFPRVDAFLASIPEEERLFPEARRPKARIHTWLGIQEEPGKPLGQAITARYLDPHSPHVEPFLKWLRAAMVD
jgi:hypothetical protein